MRKGKWIISITYAGLSFVLLSSRAKVWEALTGGGSCKRGKQQTASSKHESPFACDRLALDAEARRRHFGELWPALRLTRKAVRELPNGYEFQFPANLNTMALVAEWAAGERRCCPFLDIELRMEQEGGPFWLRLTGRKGTKNSLRLMEQMLYSAEETE